MQGFGTSIDVYCSYNSCESQRTTVATHGIITTTYKARDAPGKINAWDIAVLRTADTLPGNAVALGQVRICLRRHSIMCMASALYSGRSVLCCVHSITYSAQLLPHNEVCRLSLSECACYKQGNHPGQKYNCLPCCTTNFCRRSRQPPTLTCVSLGTLVQQRAQGALRAPRRNILAATSSGNLPAQLAGWGL